MKTGIETQSSLEEGKQAVMSTITETAQANAGPGLDCYPLYRMTVDKYEAMVATGVFTKRDRVQLINSLLVAKVTKNPPHCIVKGNSADAVGRVIPAPRKVAATEYRANERRQGYAGSRS
jgi:hypothetical protein